MEARKFVHLHSNPASMKATFSQASGLHRTLSEGIYIQMMLLNDIDTCMYVLQTVNHSAGDLELSFKPEKYMSYLFNGDKHLRKGILCERAPLD